MCPNCLNTLSQNNHLIAYLICICIMTNIILPYELWNIKLNQLILINLAFPH